MLAEGLNTLTSINDFLANETISLKLDPINILDTNLPFFLRISNANYIASKQSSPVTIASKFLFPVVFTAISETTTSTSSLK